MGSPIIFAGRESKLLNNGIRLKNGTILNENGFRDFICNSDFERDTTGWSGLNGGSIVRTTTNPLAGTASADISSPSIGDGASYAFTIDRPYKAKTITITFSYDKSASGVSDFNVALYDVTAASNLSTIALTGSQADGLFIGIFTASTNTSYQLRIEATSAGTAALKIDEVHVWPESFITGSTLTETLTNKTINADNNTITNIDNNDIKALAAIDATKIANGSVDNTEFQFVNGLTSSAVGISQSQTLTNKSIDADANTITNIDNADIKSGAAIDASKIADGSVSNVEFQFINSVTSNVQTQIDAKFPTAGGTITGNLVVSGDLTVNGTTTTLNTATLDVEDKNINVNVNGNDASAEGAGLTVTRTGTFGSFIYQNSLTSKWKLGALGSEIEVADVSSMQTFTNKTINSTSNILSRTLTSYSANQTIAIGTDDIVLVTGNTTITLPTASGNSGRTFVIKKTDTVGTTVTVASGSNIDGAASQSLTQQYESITVVSDGTVWHII